MYRLRLHNLHLRLLAVCAAVVPAPTIKPVSLATSMVVALSLMMTSGAQAQGVKVIELFTSQGCSSCPPADELLGEFMSNRDDVLALEFHVDYWNSLVYGADGSWTDPFSAPEYTERQRIYRSKKLRGREGVYTPQAVVNGSFVAVGSDKRRLKKELNRAAELPLSLQLNEDDSQLLVTIKPTEDRPWTDLEKQADVVFVRFIKQVETEITAGENRHLTIANHNVVTHIEPISADSRGEYRVNPETSENEGCAILVQPRNLGPILGAAVCP